MIILSLLFSQVTFAQMKVNLFKKEEPIIQFQNDKKPLTKVRHKNANENVQSEAGNLPSEYKSRKLLSQNSQDNPIILPAVKQNVGLSHLNIGDLVKARILESVIAFSEGKAPIRAMVTSGPLKNAIFVGEGTLERTSKRILITFQKFRKATESSFYDVNAQVLDLSGILGLEGKLHSGEPTFFAAELLSAGAAGYADSTVDRNPNALGNTVDVISSSNAAKKAISTALSRTADHFAEKIKQVPEYSVLDGPAEIQILITDQPKLNQ